MHVLAIDGSPQGHGRTAIAMREVLAAAEASGATTGMLTLADDGALEPAIEELAAADGVVIGTPVYRASLAFPLKTLLDQLPRGMWGETRAPLQGKAAVIVATSADLHHFLALDDMRNVLASFFAAHVVPPGLHVPREGFTDDDRLDPDYAEQARRQGRGLVELAGALRECPTLRGLVAQA